jgi:hypothetical protein
MATTMITMTTKILCCKLQHIIITMMNTIALMFCCKLQHIRPPWWWIIMFCCKLQHTRLDVILQVVAHKTSMMTNYSVATSYNTQDLMFYYKLQHIKPPQWKIRMLYCKLQHTRLNVVLQATTHKTPMMTNYNDFLQVVTHKT